MRVALALFVMSGVIPAVAHATPAASTVAAALDAMGGEARVRGVHSIHTRTVSTWSSVEANERPEAPWDVYVDQSEEWLDFDRGAWRLDDQYATIQDNGAWKPFGMLAAGGVTAMRVDGVLQVGPPVYLGDASERLLYYQPGRLLLAARDATDLRADGTEVLGGQPIERVAFHRDGASIRLLVDARTHRLVAADVVHALPEDFFWRVRGDIADRYTFTQWVLDPSGVWFARQLDEDRAGIPYHKTVALLLEPNTATASTFAIPDEIRAAYPTKARGPASTPARGEEPIHELAPGIWLAPAKWNALWLAQPGGALLVDAPISEVYVGRELAEIERRTGTPAAAAVLSNHIVPQLSGLREAAAHGLALHTLDANVDYVKQLLATPHTLVPDLLARSPRPARVVPVAARTVIGTGATRAELVPMRTTLGERVVLVYVPAARLLWTSNALDVDDKHHADPSRLAELRAVIAREHLDVDRVVGAQLPPTAWATIH